MHRFIHSGLGSKYQFIDINGTLINGIRIWRKAQEKYSWFLYWGLYFPLPSHLQCLSPGSLPLSFAKSITGSPLTPCLPTSTIPFSSLHSSLLPSSTLFLFSFLCLQDRKELQFGHTPKVLFPLYELFFCHTAIIPGALTAGI